MMKFDFGNDVHHSSYFLFLILDIIAGIFCNGRNFLDYHFETTGAGVERELESEDSVDFASYHISGR